MGKCAQHYSPAVNKEEAVLGAWLCSVCRGVVTSQSTMVCHLSCCHVTILPNRTRNDLGEQRFCEFGDDAYMCTQRLVSFNTVFQTDFVCQAKYSCHFYSSSKCFVTTLCFC